jgi:hypothetical protein
MDPFGKAVRGRVGAIDVVLLAAVPVALVAVFALPRPIRQSFALSYAEPTLVDAYLSNFVHLSLEHFLTNVLVYLVLAPTAYLCYLLADEADRFRVAFVVFLAVLPFVLSALNVIILRPLVGYGFSGVNMAFLGLLPLALVDYAGVQFDSNFTIDHALTLFFAGSILIAVLIVPSRVPGIVAVGIATLGLAIYGYEVVRATSVSRLCDAHTETPPGYGELAVAGLLLFGLTPFVTFPPVSTDASTVLNYYTHFLGFCFGFVVPFVTYRITDAVG